MNMFRNFFKFGFSKNLFQFSFFDVTKIAMLSSFLMVNKFYTDYNERRYKCSSEAIST